MTIIKDPQIISKVFSDEEFNNLKSLFTNDRVKSFEFQNGFSRFIISDNGMPELKQYSEKLIPMARKLFDSESLMPTYTLFSHYKGPEASLHKHKDDNACTYTIDMCVYQKNSWDLWIEDNQYTLYPNQAAAYYGNEQMHWREEFPNKETNHVAMIFFHFAEPDHWFFTKGPSYLSVIRQEMTEEQWKNNFDIML